VTFGTLFFFEAGNESWSPDPGRLVRPVKPFGGELDDAPLLRVTRRLAARLAVELVHRPDEPARVGSPVRLAALMWGEPSRSRYLRSAARSR
jgi:hypothetical protein